MQTSDRRQIAGSVRRGDQSTGGRDQEGFTPDRGDGFMAVCIMANLNLCRLLSVNCILIKVISKEKQSLSLTLGSPLS